VKQSTGELAGAMLGLEAALAGALDGGLEHALGELIGSRHLKSSSSIFVSSAMVAAAHWTATATRAQTAFLTQGMNTYHF